MNNCHDRVRAYSRGNVYRKCQVLGLLELSHREFPVHACAWRAPVPASGQRFGHSGAFWLIQVCPMDVDLSGVDGPST